jgi:hypothetical protein
MDLWVGWKHSLNSLLLVLELLPYPFTTMSTLISQILAFSSHPLSFFTNSSSPLTSTPFFITNTPHRDRSFSTTRTAEIVLMAIAGAILLALIVQRAFDKELLALVFIILHVLGHWVMTIITILSKDPSSFLFTYVFLMALGEFVKLCFLLLAENPEVKWLTKPMLFGITGLFLLIWLAVMVLQIVIWLIEY